jgi:YVTN family beta-propeller protein
MDNAVAPDLHWLQPIGRKELLARMLRNLKLIYARQNNDVMRFKTIHWILTLQPKAPAELSARAILYVIMTVMLVTPAEALKSEFIMASEASFNLPHDLALSPDGRYLYVADNGNDRIAVLNPDTLKVIGSIGGSERSAPHDAAFDRKGRLLVADSGNDRVVLTWSK